jgi:hypothetical protein
MKKLIVSLLLTASLTGFGQKKLLDVLPLNNGVVFYSEVIEVDSIRKDELYKRAKRWFVEAYKDANKVIQLDDKESGEIIGKGSFDAIWNATFVASHKVNVAHTLKIKVKDGKYRYEITDFRVRYVTSSTQYTSSSLVDYPIETWNMERPENTRKFLPQVNTSMVKLIGSINDYMTTKATNEDW